MPTVISHRRKMATRMNQKERNRYGVAQYNVVSITEICVTYKACKKNVHVPAGVISKDNRVSTLQFSSRRCKKHIQIPREC
jgi:hypothetical protein